MDNHFASLPAGWEETPAWVLDDWWIY